MRVALVHDWLTGMRGGERLLLSLARLFPKAPIYTLLHVRGSVVPELEARDIRTTFVQHLPGAATRYRNYLPLFPAAASTIRLEEFDLVVSSSHCVAKGVQPRAGALHLCYCHTPMRYVWDRYDDYFGDAKPPMRWILPVVAAKLRSWDARTSSRVSAFAANSAYVASRIRNYYRRDAEVIPPPVDTDFFTPGEETGGTYDLVVSALVPYKRIDLVLEAYRGTGWPLKVVGRGPEDARLRAGAPPEASFLGWVDDMALRDLYRGCRAVVMPGVEDFGIVPLEAMACGRPAVVFSEGGGKESVVDGETGILFHEPTPGALRAAIDSLRGVRFNSRGLRAHAQGFGRATFEARFQDFVTRSLGASSADVASPW